MKPDQKSPVRVLQKLFILKAHILWPYKAKELIKMNSQAFSCNFLETSPRKQDMSRFRKRKMKGKSPVQMGPADFIMS